MERKGRRSSGVALPVMPLPEADEHVVDRPSWDCRSCDKPWPCDPVRERLVLELDRVRLAIYMWLNLEEAASDMPKEPASEMFERFIRWTH